MAGFGALIRFSKLSSSQPDQKFLTGELGTGLLVLLCWEQAYWFYSSDPESTF